MTELTFDTFGHLTPYDLIDVKWELFVRTFGWNDTRRELLESLRLLINALIELSINTFTIWIDGSFVTQKEQPNDIDFVFVLPSVTYREFEGNLRTLRNQYAGLDVYYVRRIDEHDQDYFLYVSDRTEWLFQFTKTKPDRLTRRKFSKGFIQIAWSNESAV